MEETEYKNCRANCGICCIYISISSPIPGMPHGKPAGIRCPHLTEDIKCAIFNSPDRPKVCSDYKFDSLVCGTNREEAMKIHKDLEGIE